jgi:MFS transporter, DHA1 family, multidrug resistance protein
MRVAAKGAPGDGGVSVRLLLVLVVATALGPMAMQIFVPALPAIQEGFGVTPATAQLTLSLSAFSIALATLAYGPLSDRFGRRPALLGGLVVYLAGSALCGLATSMGWLIAGRIVQAAGGCAGIVLTRAIVRDLYDLDRSAQMLAYITMAMVAAPMLAPALGGVLTDLAGWRSVFVFGGVLGVAVAAVVAAELPETSPPGNAAGRAGRHGMLHLLRSRAFWGYSLHVAFSIGLFYAFLAAAPFLMVRVMGRPASEYGLLFVLVPGAFMLGNLVAARVSARVGVDRMIAIGSAGALAGALALLGLDPARAVPAHELRRLRAGAHDGERAGGRGQRRPALGGGGVGALGLPADGARGGDRAGRGLDGQQHALPDGGRHGRLRRGGAGGGRGRPAQRRGVGVRRPGRHALSATQRSWRRRSSAASSRNAGPCSPTRSSGNRRGCHA